MLKAAVCDGDQTTTRGRVFAFASSIFDEGRHVALSGEMASCGVCPGLHHIFGTGDEITEEVRSVVLHGDRVLCPCGRNLVIASSEAGILVEVNSTPTGHYSMPSHGQTTSDTNMRTQWISFVLKDGAGLSCVAHFADGSTERGTIDGNNRVRFERANESRCQRFEIVIDGNGTNSPSVTEALLSALHH